MFDSLGLDVYYSTKNHAPLLAHTFYFSWHDRLRQCEKRGHINFLLPQQKEKERFSMSVLFPIHVQPRLSIPENSMSVVALCYIFVVAPWIQCILFFSIFSCWFLLRKRPQLKVLARVCTSSIIFAACTCLTRARLVAHDNAGNVGQYVLSISGNKTCDLHHSLSSE